MGQSPRIRSLLFIPATKPQLWEKAVAVGADAIVWDLEDAVPDQLKAEARDTLATHLRSTDVPLPQFVRINGLDSSHALHDLAAVVGPATTGVMVPKVEGPDDIAVVDRVLVWLEQDSGVALGRTAIVPVFETAAGMRRAYDIASASPRIAYTGGLGPKGGDVERSLGYRWSPEGTETFVMRSQILLDVRAAGVPNPLTGMWADIADLDGLRAFARAGRDLGYEGMVVIHPSHVAVVNEEFSDGSTDLERDRRLVLAMREASARGEGSTTFEGVMIDKAMEVASLARLSAAGIEL